MTKLPPTPRRWFVSFSGGRELRDEGRTGSRHVHVRLDAAAISAPEPYPGTPFGSDVFSPANTNSHTGVAPVAAVNTGSAAFTDGAGS